MLPGQGIIDATPFWDDNGHAYLVHAWAARRAGINSLRAPHQLSPEGTRALEGRNIHSSHDANPMVEGSKPYKCHGYYYLFTPAGGVATGW